MNVIQKEPVENICQVVSLITPPLCLSQSKSAIQIAKWTGGPFNETSLKSYEVRGQPTLFFSPCTGAQQPSGQALGQYFIFSSGSPGPEHVEVNFFHFGINERNYGNIDDGKTSVLVLLAS